MENTPVINCSSTWVSTLFSKEKFFNFYYKFTQRSRFYGSPNSVGWNHSARKVCPLSQLIKPIIHEEAKTNDFLGKYFEKQIFSMHSCATSFNSNLTQGSIIKWIIFCPNMQMMMCTLSPLIHFEDIFFRLLGAEWDMQPQCV